MASKKRIADTGKTTRLIDANALGIGKAKREAFDNPAYADGWNSAIAIIEDAPTVDAVEVVRCNKCFYWDKATVNKQGFLICPASGMDIMANDFCSFGERKDNA